MPVKSTFELKYALLVFLAHKFSEREVDEFPLGAQASDLQTLGNKIVVEIDVGSGHTPNVSKVVYAVKSFNRPPLKARSIRKR